jgi:arylsulfatase A-like enzyme
VSKPGVACEKIVSSLDFAETFLELSGTAVPDRMQGRSLAPLLRGEAPADWRTAFYYHYYEYPQPHHVRPHYGVITDRYTLAHFYWPDVDYWELFDREKDPQEMTSVFGDPAYAGVQTNLLQEVARLRQELKEPPQDDPKAYGVLKQLP